jgi:hypothetical protein
MPNHLSQLRAIERHLRPQSTPQPALRLAGTPDFPLAFNVSLPADFAFPHGHLAVRFEDLEVTGAESFHLDPDRSAVTDDGATVWLNWERLCVTGRYTVAAKSAPVITMDTAGSMFDFDDSDMLPAGSEGSDPVEPLDPTTEQAMLDNARAQRTRLMDNPNGQQLMGVYNEHNETFNSVFVNSSAARGSWAGDGTTREMAVHTHGAVPADGSAPPANTPVNPTADQQLFGPQQKTYNQGAFNQQLQMVVNTIAQDPNFNPFQPGTPDPNSPYTKASLAALTFGNAIEQTGNSKEVAVPLNKDQVYQSVSNGTAPTPATVDQLSNIIQQGSQPGGRAAAVAQERNWRVLDEDDRRLVRRCLFAVAEERAAHAKLQFETLWSGACGGQISRAAARLEFVTEASGFRFVSASVELPAFELDLDDAAWQGDAAAILRERLAEAAFIHSLLRERLRSALGDHLAGTARAGYVEA